HSQYQDDIIYWLVAIRLRGLSPLIIRQSLARFGNMRTLFSVSQEELNQAGLTTKQIQSLQNPDWHMAERDLHWCQKNDCHINSLINDHYPKLLQEIQDAPLLLFVKGDLELLAKPQLAIVGTRHPTYTGKKIAEQFAHLLVKAGLIITSG